MVVVALSNYIVVTGVGQCAVDEITATGAGALTRVCLHVPGEIAWDDCACGSFQQTVTTFLWSDNATGPIPEYRDDQSYCGPNFIGVEVAAEVLRCIPGVTNEADAPDCDDLAAASRDWHLDAYAMRNGIVCCLREMLTARTIEGWSIVSHTPLGPLGGCGGSRLTYRFWLPNCDACD